MKSQTLKTEPPRRPGSCSFEYSSPLLCCRLEGLTPQWARWPASRVEPAPGCPGSRAGLSLGVCGLAPARGTAHPPPPHLLQVTPPSAARAPPAPCIRCSPGGLPPASSSLVQAPEFLPRLRSSRGSLKPPDGTAVTIKPSSGNARQEMRVAQRHPGREPPSSVFKKLCTVISGGTGCCVFLPDVIEGSRGASECLGAGSRGQVLRPGRQAPD